MARDHDLQTRLPIGFAHRGGPLYPAEANSLSAFSRALELGVRGLESDVQLTADGVPVLCHRSLPGRGIRIGRLRRDDLPAHICSLEQLYRSCGSDFDLALDLSASAASRVVAVARRHHAEERLWLTYFRVQTLAVWRTRWPAVRLVLPTMALPTFGGSPSLLERLSAAGVDAVNIHWRRCSQGFVDSAHRCGLLCFAWGARDGATAARQLARGVDGVFVDDTRGLLRAFNVATPGFRSLARASEGEPSESTHKQ